MKKLNATVYHKLLLQAEEAKLRDSQEMTKLAAAICNSLGPIPEDETVSYNFESLQEDIYNGLWKMATCVIKYHDLTSVDAEKVHQSLEIMAKKLIEEVEHSLSVPHTQIGPLEEKVPGQE